MNDDSAPRIGDPAAACEPLPPLPALALPPFVSHRLIRGGHLQTILSLRAPELRSLQPKLHWIVLPDGDVLALHDDQPADWMPGAPSVMLVHGLCGCRQSPYMIRLTHRFIQLGVRVFRLELRGCGVAQDRCREITHAGRSDDCLAALGRIAELSGAGPIAAVGVSLGGNQLLLAAGRIGAKQQPRPAWADRWTRLVAVSPPIDLLRCSENMERRLLRGYNRYFIGHLMRRLPAHIRQSPELMRRCARPWPRTLRELDERITAPLSGFSGADDYYRRSSSAPLLESIEVPSLILTAADDPIVPVDCFTTVSPRIAEHRSVRLLIAPGGGHVGFFARGSERFWMDQVIEHWCLGLRPNPIGAVD
jgi:uncharacterized protein